MLTEIALWGGLTLSVGGFPVMVLHGENILSPWSLVFVAGMLGLTLGIRGRIHENDEARQRSTQRTPVVYTSPCGGEDSMRSLLPADGLPCSPGWQAVSRG